MLRSSRTREAGANTDAPKELDILVERRDALHHTHCRQIQLRAAIIFFRDGNLFFISEIETGVDSRELQHSVVQSLHTMLRLGLCVDI